jgi:hypothetical protein
MKTREKLLEFNMDVCPGIARIRFLEEHPRSIKASFPI